MYHGGLIEFVNKILRCVCHQCSKLLLDKDKRPEIFKIKSQAGRFTRVAKYCDAVGECKQESDGCGHGRVPSLLNCAVEAGEE